MRSPLFNEQKRRQSLLSCFDLQYILTGIFDGTYRSANAVTNGKHQGQVITTFVQFSTSRPSVSDFCNNPWLITVPDNCTNFYVNSVITE